MQETPVDVAVDGSLGEKLWQLGQRDSALDHERKTQHHLERVAGELGRIALIGVQPPERGLERASDAAKGRAMAGDDRGYVQARDRFQRRARGGVAARLAE